MSAIKSPIISILRSSFETDWMVGYNSSTGQYQHNADCFAIEQFHPIEDSRTINILAAVATGIGIDAFTRRLYSTLVVASIVDRFKQAKDESVDSLFIEAFSLSGERIANYNASKPTSESGCVVCAAVFIWENSLYIASIGHCRIFLQREGTLRQISVEHTFIQRLKEQGYITDEELTASGVRWDGPITLRCIGWKKPSPDFRLKLECDEDDEKALANQGIRLYSGDKILLCTSGLYKQYMTLEDSERLQTLLSQDIHPQEAVDKLVALQRETGNLADITAVALVIPESKPTEKSETKSETAYQTRCNFPPHTQEVDMAQPVYTELILDNQFLGGFFHEIRNPLTYLMGYARILRTESLGYDAHQNAIDRIPELLDSLKKFSELLCERIDDLGLQQDEKDKISDFAREFADSISQLRELMVEISRRGVKHAIVLQNGQTVSEKILQEAEGLYELWKTIVYKRI